MEVDSGDSRVRVFARLCPGRPQEQPCVRLSEAGRAIRILSEIETPAWVENAKLDPLRTETAADAARWEAQEFVFDGVFPGHAAQEEVFDAVGRPVLRECLSGFNGTVFAYGQTGSGKTHSLLNLDRRAGEQGILARLADELFEQISQDVEAEYKVEVAAMQVYNEQVDDLLHASHNSGGGRNLNVWFSGEVPSLTWLECRGSEKLGRTFAKARKNLIYAETKLNKASSRSHAIFQIRITRKSRAGAGDSTCSRLCVVDLAGSERVKKSGVQGAQFKEAIAINNSLLTLGNVVSALAAKKPFVPYRDSRLTHILSPSIGANCKTTLLVCASPSIEHVQETLCSLKFASRAMHIEVNAHVNRLVEVEAQGVLSELASANAAGQAEVNELVVARHATEEAVERAEQAEASARQAIEEARESAEQAEALARQEVAEATERAESAEARATSADTALAEATSRAEQAEARAALAERAAADAQEALASAETSPCKMAVEEHEKAVESAREESRAQAELAEQEAATWRERHKQALLQIALLEDRIAQLTRELQQRNATIESLTARLDQLQANIAGREDELRRQLEEATEAGQGAERARAKAVQLEAESQRALLDAAEQQARAAREADQLAQERAHSELLAKRRLAAVEEVEAEKQQVAAQQAALQEQEKTLAQRLALVEGLEREKRTIMRQQQELRDQQQKLSLLDRRLRNSLGAQAAGPPLRAQEELQKLDQRRNLFRVASESILTSPVRSHSAMSGSERGDSRIATPAKLPRRAGSIELYN